MIEQIRNNIKKYWGYQDFRPLQKQSMDAIANGQDVILILPTGGGKSLCFQAPAVSMDGLTIVVSPLISLMKDQVDGLIEYGISAARLDSSLDFTEQREVFQKISRNQLKMLYVSPERLVSNGFLDILKRTQLSFIAIDEAHCVSMWGHDFRPEYRQLNILRQTFPQLSIAAYTATATKQVQDDIAEQLNLKNPKVFVGSFDRPNLIYKVSQINDKFKDICKVLDRHKSESGIIYCITRKEVDRLSLNLKAAGYRAAAYHAGMSDNDRKKNQDAFINEKINIIVATIAFGMGIDKSNVRFVIHTGMSKSLENYQQESGRAGRDGLEAECCLFYSNSDFMLWKGIMRDMPKAAYQIAMAKLESMQQFCLGNGCRHKAILEYFGQDLDKDNCNACDICLGEVEYVNDALVVGQKILSCIARLEQRFGSGYTAMVLTGSNSKDIIANGHNNLSTYGLLKDYSKAVISNWIMQLCAQGFLNRVGEYNVLQITASGRNLLKGQQSPRLYKPAQKPAKVSTPKQTSWEGVDKQLFEDLRQLRMQIASEKNIPAYLVFGDAALRDMARRCPVSLDQFRTISGVGDEKCKKYGKRFIKIISSYAKDNPTPAADTEHSRPASYKSSSNLNTSVDAAIVLFKQKKSIAQISQILQRAPSTIVQYLIQYIRQEQISDYSQWMDVDTFDKIFDAAQSLGTAKLKPIYDHFNGDISYDTIRIALECMNNMR